jgi:hypothetical protein
MVKDQPNHPLKPKNIQNCRKNKKNIEYYLKYVFMSKKAKATHKKARRVIKNHRYTRIHTDAYSLLILW